MIVNININHYYSFMMLQKGVFVPIPCPGCNQGVYSSQRALSLHMNKCAYDLFQSSSSKPTKHSRLLPPTNAQRAHQILQSMKSPHISGMCQNVNRLEHPTRIATMSLSSTGMDNMDNHFTGIDNACSDSNYNSSNITDNTFGNEINTQPATTSITDHNENNNILKSNRTMILPPGVQFGIYLQHILSSHRGVDLKLHNEITDLVMYHSTTLNTDFS